MLFEYHEERRNFDAMLYQVKNNEAVRRSFEGYIKLSGYPANWLNKDTWGGQYLNHTTQNQWQGWCAQIATASIARGEHPRRLSVADKALALGYQASLVAEHQSALVAFVESKLVDLAGWVKSELYLDHPLLASHIHHFMAEYCKES